MAELIVAFDQPSGREALALAARLQGLRWAKLGPVLHVREGPALVREFQARGVRVFLDLKWHDIPSIVAAAVTAAREQGVAMATVHALAGPVVLAAAAEAAGAAGGAREGGNLALVGVTVLTSHDTGDFERVVGRGVPDLGFEAERLARLSVEAGLQGVVASGDELTLLREALGPNPWLVVPGIRAGDEATSDQKRTVTAADAVRRGATHLVVGRPITQARDPVRAYQQVLESAASRLP